MLKEFEAENGPIVDSDDKEEKVIILSGLYDLGYLLVGNQSKHLCYVASLLFISFFYKIHKMRA